MRRGKSDGEPWMSGEVGMCRPGEWRRTGIEVSHPCARKKAQGWGTEDLRGIQDKSGLRGCFFFGVGIELGLLAAGGFGLAMFAAAQRAFIAAQLVGGFG